MRKWTLLVGLSAVLAFAGCGDDTAQKTNNGANNGANNGGTDMGGGNNGMNNGANNGGTDMGGNNGGTDMGGNNGGTDMGGNNGGTDMGSGADPVDITWPATPGDFVSSSTQSSYVDTLVIPDVEGNTPTCCVDFGDRSRDDGTDNALANLAKTAQTLIGLNFQTLIDSSLSSGQLVLVVDHRELDGADDADGFVLSWLRSEFEGSTDADSASNGNGTFAVTEDSFIGGNTGEPLNVFNPADMTGGTMSAGPGEISLVIPFGVTVIDAPIKEVSLLGTATTIDADGVVYTEGEMGGYVLLDDIFGSMNEIADNECGCLELSGDLYEKDGSGKWSGNCVSDAASKCTATSEEVCVSLGSDDLMNDNGVCGLLPGLLNNGADIDVDDSGDDTYEGLSAGFKWTAVKADVVSSVAP